MNALHRTVFTSLLLIPLLVAPWQATAGSFNANFNDLALPAGTTLYSYGSTTSVRGVPGDGFLQLTGDQNSQSGLFVLPILDPGETVNGFSGSFRVYLGHIPYTDTAIVADGMSFNFAPAAAYSTLGSGYHIWEEGIPVGYGALSLNIDTFSNDFIDVGVELSYNGSRLVINPVFGQGNPFELLGWHTVTFNLDANGLDIDIGTIFNIENFDIFAYGFSPTSDYQFGFGARTGGFSEYHWVDDISITTSTASAPVPEPSTMLLLGSGLMGLVGYGRRRMKK